MASRSKTTKKRATARPQRSASVQIVEEEVVQEGGDWETAVAVITAVVLIVAIVLTDIHLGRYGAGLFS